MENNKLSFLVLTLAIIIAFSLSGSTILTPLWLDSIDVNITEAGENSFKKSDVYFELFISNLVILIVVSVPYLWYSSCHKFKPADYAYPKLYFYGMGLADALSSMCFVFASSGNRLAPYLQAIVTNFSVPVTFIVRFIVLKKVPSKKKLLCTVAVLVALFISLLPNIFPSITSRKSRKENGGASGVAAILWPLCFAAGYIPRSLMNVLIEKSTKCVVVSGYNHQTQIHSLYLIFWSVLYSFVCIVCLFGFDLLPGFGMTSGLEDFLKTFFFNFQCFLGVATDGCKSDFRTYSYLCIMFLLVNRFGSVWFLKVSEGANYLAVVQCFQMPIVVLFWTLFTEQPFQWKPHLNIGTWMAVLALIIMLPATIMYNKGQEISLNNTQNIRKLNPDSSAEETIPFFRTQTKNDHKYSSITSEQLAYNEESMY